jgi:hypothetical protein
MAARSWINDHQRKISERGGMHFSTTTIGYGLMAGPVGVVLAPIVYPIILLWKAVCTLGYNLDQQDSPRAVELLQSELHDLEESATPLNDLPAAKAARLFATVQVIAASPVMHRKAIDALSCPPATGARSTVPRIGSR